MNELLLTYGLPGVIISALVTGMAKVYTDNRTLTTKLEQVSQARVDDLKEVNSAKDAASEKMSLMIQLIYDKLEKGRK